MSPQPQQPPTPSDDRPGPPGSPVGDLSASPVSNGRAGYSRRTRAVLPVWLMSGGVGVSFLVAVGVYVLLYDPEPNPLRETSGEFYPLLLGLISAVLGAVAGTVALAVATWQLRDRLGGAHSRVTAVVLVLCLVTLGVVAAHLFAPALQLIATSVGGQPTRRIDIAAPVVAAALCVVVAPLGIGVALHRRTRAVGVVATIVVVVAALAVVPLAWLDATRAKEAAAASLPYVLPEDIPLFADAVRDYPLSVGLSDLTRREAYELQVPLSVTLGDPYDDELEDLRSHDEFYIMLSESLDCDGWRETRECLQLSEDTVLKRHNGVLVVREAPGGTAYCCSTTRITAHSRS